MYLVLMTRISQYVEQNVPERWGTRTKHYNIATDYDNFRHSVKSVYRYLYGYI